MFPFLAGLDDAVGVLEETAILVDNIVHAVPSEAHEVVGTVHNRLVFSLGVAHDESTRQVYGPQVDLRVGSVEDSILSVMLDNARQFLRDSALHTSTSSILKPDEE